ncbi:unnamed protein product [Phytomonas sp. EM1]|nr:unnamed protein product [Phytomonas sp. EM1]|eukprot:CCW64713.1 unnamed protein product [Phytomonas sp. isolate EM1]
MTNAMRSKGYGFIYYRDGASTEAAIKELNGREVLGRRIKVRYAGQQRPVDDLLEDDPVKGAEEEDFSYYFSMPHLLTMMDTIVDHEDDSVGGEGGGVMNGGPCLTVPLCEDSADLGYVGAPTAFPKLFDGAVGSCTGNTSSRSPSSVLPDE